MIPFRAAMILGVLVGGTAACGTPKEVTASESQPILNSPTDLVHAFSLGICSGSGPSQCSFQCNGTLIAPNLVLSVRHCFYQAPRTPTDCTSGEFGPAIGAPSDYWVTASPDMGARSAQFHRVESINAPASTALCGSDLVVLILADNVPSSEAMPATPLFTQPSSGQLIAAIGFGISSPGATDFGVRRIRQGVPIQCVPGSSSSEDCHDFVPTLVQGEFVAAGGACEGDSGSGAFDQSALSDGRGVVLGVFSRGGGTTENCVPNIYEELGPWQGFIASTARHAAILGNFPAPAWADVATSRALGASCNGNDDCDSGSCASADDGISWYCTQPCIQSAAASCPAGFSCIDRRGVELCFAAPPETPTPSADSSSCSIPNGGLAERHSSAALVVALCVCAMVSRRRARRNRR